MAKIYPWFWLVVIIGDYSYSRDVDMAVAGYNLVAPSPCVRGVRAELSQQLSKRCLPPCQQPATTQVVIHGEQIYILIFSSHPILV